jgi:hypothetical protein
VWIAALPVHPLRISYPGGKHVRFPFHDFARECFMRLSSPILHLTAVVGLVLGGHPFSSAVRADDAKKPVAATPAPKVDKDGKPQAGFIKAHESYVALAKKGGIDVLFLGDSIESRRPHDRHQ